MAPETARAWAETGHMVVTQIAYDRLSPSARAEVDRLIGVLAEHEPRFTDAVTASMWMDAVRAMGWRAFDTWHFVNLPFNEDGLENLEPRPSGMAVEAVRQSVATLADPDTPDLAKAIMLRVLLHVVGDLHQPLHCTSRFTLAHPEGDRGGGAFPLAIDGEPEWTNLHRLWDGTAGLLPPLGADEVGAARVPELVEELLASVPESRLEGWQELDPAVWAREGFRLATSLVYVGITERRPPSEIYLRKARLVVSRRLVIAGLRLGALLEQTIPAGMRAYEPVDPAGPRKPAGNPDDR